MNEPMTIAEMKAHAKDCGQFVEFMKTQPTRKHDENCYPGNTHCDACKDVAKELEALGA